MLGLVWRCAQAVCSLCELGEGVDTSRMPSDVAIEMVRETDGSVVVFPALAEVI